MNKACEIDLNELLKLQFIAKNLKLANNNKANILTSDNLTKNLGRGMEYAESRIYQPGDDVRHIDWRITARHGKTYTKLYHEEKGENNIFILDLTDSLYFGTKYALKSVIASKVASLLAWAGYNQNNNIGGLVFNNDEDIFTPTKGTKNNLIKFFNDIVHLHNAGNSNSTKPNTLTTIIEKLDKIIKSNNRIFIISDFLNLNNITQHIINKLQKINYRNLVYLIRIADPIENLLLAPGNYNISNGQENNIITINQENADLFKNFFSDKLSTYNRLIKDFNFNNFTIETKEDWYHKLWQLSTQS